MVLWGGSDHPCDRLGVRTVSPPVNEKELLAGRCAALQNAPSLHPVVRSQWRRGGASTTPTNRLFLLAQVMNKKGKKRLCRVTFDVGQHKPPHCCYRAGEKKRLLLLPWKLRVFQSGLGVFSGNKSGGSILLVLSVSDMYFSTFPSTTAQMYIHVTHISK